MPTRHPVIPLPQETPQPGAAVLSSLRPEKCHAFTCVHTLTARTRPVYLAALLCAAGPALLVTAVRLLPRSLPPAPFVDSPCWGVTQRSLHSHDKPKPQLSASIQLASCGP